MIITINLLSFLTSFRYSFSMKISSKWKVVSVEKETLKKTKLVLFIKFQTENRFDI